MSVVVVGSLNMDIVMLVDQMPIIGETLLGEDVRYFYGGKGTIPLGTNCFCIWA